jgi:protein involved in polysaccharide export with SLBB domain
MQVLQYMRVGVAAIAFAGAASLGAQTPDTTRVFPVVYPRTLTVQPGDVLHVRIWREADLSGDFTVAANGEVVLPKLGRTQAAGISPDSLQRQLINAYAVYLRNPAIDISIGRRISVLGQVKSPGSYRVDPTQTIADLITAAGGFTGSADPKKIRITRRGTVVLTKFPQYATLAELQVNSGDELTVDKRKFTITPRGVYASLSATLALIYLAKRSGIVGK